VPKARKGETAKRTTEPERLTLGTGSYYIRRKGFTMTMTRQHFEMIARVLRNAQEDYDGESVEDVFNNLRYEFMRELRSTNPNFDSDRFMRAATPNPYQIS